MIDIAILVASEIVSAGLAFALVFFLFRAYRLTRFVYLLGPPIGFSFLAFSYFFLGMSLLCENDVAVSESFLWLRLVTQSFGFAFIAFSYYFSSKTERITKYFLGLIAFASVTSILLVFVALIVAPPFLGIPCINVLDEYFRMVNLIFLGYVICHLVKHFEPSQGTISGLVWAPLAFSLLWLGQYSLLIWGIDGGQTAFVLAHVARLASLTLFIRIYCWSGRARQ